MRRAWLSIAGTWVLVGCIGDVELPPAAPTVLPVQTPTRQAKQVLSGTKPRGTAVLSGDAVWVALDDSETWSYAVTLQSGENNLELRSRSASGLVSARAARVAILFESPFPASPTVAAFASPTNTSPLVLSGTKPARTLLELDGTEVVPLDETIEWSYALPLRAGDHVYTLLAKDERGQSSEPVELRVVLDQQAPAIRARVPAANGSAAPTNTEISVAFDGALDLDPLSVDPALMRVTADGQEWPGSITYRPLSFALVFVPTQPLPANRNVDVSLDPTLIVDLAGNPAAPGPSWSYAFGTGAQADRGPPPSPVLDNALPATTTDRVLDLRGTKPPRASVRLGAQEIVAADDQTAWSYPLTLAVGANLVALRTASQTGVLSAAATTATVTRQIARPSAPLLDPAPPSTTDTAQLAVGGTREPNTSILINGTVVVPRGADARWDTTVDLIPGPNELEVRARDGDGVTSDPQLVTVDFVQPYAGTVPTDFQLTFAFSLRDLSAVDPIRNSFETGSNNYAVDIWIEGPLAPGETCQMSGTERQNIKYLATLEHYKGSKSNHENPFAEPDYAATDYLAALIEGGALRSVGLSPGTTRRAGNGRLLGGITQALTVASIDAIDATCTAASSINVDGCTSATTRAGAKVVRWVPLDPDSRRIPQGDYVLGILINLDRDPNWVTSHDVETCWGQSSDARRGQHRIMRKIGLGATPYTQTLSTSSEAAGPDAEGGADQLNYLGADGIRLTWGPVR